MATGTATRGNDNKADNKPARERKPAPAIHERMKNQLTTAALRGKVKVDELENLEAHIGKLKGLIDA